MAKNDNMTPPDYPTRAELRAELANHPTHADLRAELANHPTHAELAEQLATLRAEIAADTRALLEQFEVRTRASNAVLLEDAFKRFRVIDDQYKDLPGRVQKLEEVVFPSTPRGRRKRSG